LPPPLSFDASLPPPLSFEAPLLQAQYARLLDEMAALKRAQKEQDKRTASTRIQSEATLAEVNQLRSELQVG
jgi:hypothetical protein